MARMGADEEKVLTTEDAEITESCREAKDGRWIFLRALRG
jgi:hypothetical protein